jgi:flagellar motility protein MotE (MotC chaperone)
VFEEEEVKKKKKPRNFTETEQKILTSLSERQKLLNARSLELDRRENKLKSLQEDIQQQVTQLEKLQLAIKKDIEKKKIQDDSQLEKAVALYSKMDAATAAESISKLDRGIAVNILKQMKEKQASLVLASMGASESANLIAEMTTKK